MELLFISYADSRAGTTQISPNNPLNIICRSLNLSSSEPLAPSCKDAAPACQKDEVVGQGYSFCWTFMQKEAKN